jgi:hypothetical protein
MPESDPNLKPKFVCEVEAAALLNCVAASDYHEAKCVALMKKLRKCIQRERVVKFQLEGIEPPASTSATTQTEATQPPEPSAQRAT